jgi:hypothetical protein
MIAEASAAGGCGAGRAAAHRPALRADAERNRQRLIASAREVFAGRDRRHG